MCEICNGTHVIHTSGVYTAFIRTCPTCGPKPQEQLLNERKERLKKLAEAKAEFGMETVIAL